MRAKYVAVLALSVTLPCVASAEEPYPNPEGCSSYAKNSTGGDTDCDAAIAKETDSKAKSVMLFRRAYMEDAAGNIKTYPKALADLGEAIRLWPENVQALHERGYLYNEYGRWKEAETDLDIQIKLLPTSSEGYQERALARFNQADLQGAFDDRNIEVTLNPNDPAHLIARAWASMWLGHFDDARHDTERAEGLAKQSGDADKQKKAADLISDIALWTKVSDPAFSEKACLEAKTEAELYKPTFIGDCTRAFLDAKSASKKADALTQRSMMMPVAKQERSAGLDDLRIAYALDPNNSDRMFNLGSGLVGDGRNHEAMEYLDMALKLKPSEYAYAARASAKFNLGDVAGAFFDAKKSFEIKPNELALTVLGDCLHAKTKSYDKAKGYWIAAYHLGDRDDGLVARLKDAGVPIPPPDYPNSVTNPR
jgi:tetratricopeptide (TPR) repeat protein